MGALLCFLFIHHFNLTHLHRLKCVFVALGCDAGAAFCVDGDGDLKEVRLCEHRVGNNADVGAKTDELQGFYVFFFFQKLHQRG